MRSGSSLAPAWGFFAAVMALSWTVGGCDDDGADDRTVDTAFADLGSGDTGGTPGTDTGFPRDTMSGGDTLVADTTANPDADADTNAADSDAGDEDSGDDVVAVEDCDNEVDDDGDGAIDCFDGDCAADVACAPTTAEECANGIDDDEDGAVDCDDGDCVRRCDETSEGDVWQVCVLSCVVDVQTCIDCLHGGGGGGALETACTDGLDNDSDGSADCEDPDCASAVDCG